jgi:DNA-binding protein H-NS
MPQLDLDTMDCDELWLLHERLTRTLSHRIMEEKLELEKRLALLKGADLDGSAGSHAKKRKYPKVLPKYCNPLDPTERWSGRGKKPRWLVAALLAGQKLEDFEIDDPKPSR